MTTSFAILAIVMTLATAGLVLFPLLRRPETRSPVAAALVALAIPAAVLVAYLGASNYRWTAPPAPAVATAPVEGPAAGPMADAIRTLEERLKAEPADLQGWILLGSSYTATGRPEDALAAFQKAVDLSGGKSLDARLGVAEATLLLDRNAMAGEAGQTIEAVLAEAPGNPKALWYGGMVALVRGEPEVARQRWEKLLELEPPQRIREIVEGELARLGNMAGSGAGVSAGAPAEGAAGGSITVAVTVGEGLAGKIRAGAPLFVFVRDRKAGGPPVAVVRREATELPLRVEITDQDSMLPGRTVASLQSAAIVARVANGGDPLPQPGDLYGEATWTAGGGTGGPVQVVINQAVP